MMQVRLRGRSMERVSGESSPLPPKRHGLRLLILNIVIMAQLTYVDLRLASANLHYYIYVNNVLPHLRYRPGKYEDPTPQLLYRTRELLPIDELLCWIWLVWGSNCSSKTLPTGSMLLYLEFVLYGYLFHTNNYASLLRGLPVLSLTTVYHLSQNKGYYWSHQNNSIEIPSSLNVQSSTYSKHKHHNTGISPSGACTFHFKPIHWEQVSSSWSK